ncbi:MAG: hypothetical protein Q7R39_17225, partial [Dehalococcoidia bacterium]|nr:hypothetical protein [Dehalococcoidia bacterium]
MTKRITVSERWLTAARSRLRIEVAGLAFAASRGYAPEEYARELWGRGAKGWMGQERPTPLEYLRKEAKAMATLYPWIKRTARQVAPGTAEMMICNGCLAGWGGDRWALSRSLGLSQVQVCQYCQEAFAVWGRQLGLDVTLTPRVDGTCVLRAA